VAAACVLVLLGGGGAYAVADVRGDLPGVLTDDPVPQPYPDLGTAPGATDPGRLAPSASAPVAGTPADPAAVAAAIEPLLDAPGLGPRVGASVVDATTGEVLVASADTTAYEPASVAKLLTAAAALEELGPDFRSTTRAELVPGSDELYLVGGGDLLLAAGSGNPGATVGRAGLGDLADQVASRLSAQGVTSVRLRLDDSFLGGLGWGPSQGPGVVAADLAAGFVAQVTGLAVDAGRTRRENYAPRVPDPGTSAAQAFAVALAERGIAVGGSVTRARVVEGTEVLGEVASAPLSDVVAHTLAASDNTVAEALARQVAVATGETPDFAGSGRAVLAVVARVGVPVDGLVLADGSGLSDGSLLSPRSLTGVLAAASSPDHPRLRPLVTGLPVAALTGTLVDRFDSSDRVRAAQGVVRAKTGSLTGTSALAGTVVDASGRLLAFAVLADATAGTVPSRTALDEVAAALARCGCP
jgi:D-alanyl-D-alanine carboxypeptidase/D-alanyl-D-alanine-endopeptidase (penicillin-binding protein 4)